MPMPRTPLQSILKVHAAINPDLSVSVEDDEISEYLRLLVDDMGTPSLTDNASEYFDKLLTRLQDISDDTEMLRHVCAQEASRLYQVYCLGGDYNLLEQPYRLPSDLFN